MNGITATVRCTRLENGVRVVTEAMPGVASATLGIWVLNGSRHETQQQAGISHFLEHLFFKGTERRSAAQIAQAFDAVGGHVNAFTGRESTCFYAKVLGEHLPLAQDVLGDLFRHSLFAAEEIERERTVIVQEILQSEDTPDDYVHELFQLQYWPNHPLSFPVAGRVETVEALRRDDFLAFIEARYRPDRILVAAAGAVDHDSVVAWVAETLGDMAGSTTDDVQSMPTAQRGVRVVHKDIEQAHVCIGAPGVAQVAPQRYAAYALNTALGGGMSSRLFQEIREKRGRAYSVYSFLATFSDSGYLGVYAGTSGEWIAEVVDIVRAELDDIRLRGLVADELERAKNQLKGNMLLGLETTDARMHRIARNQLFGGREIAPEEAAARIDAISNDDILAVAAEIVRPEAMAVTVLGAVDAGSVNDDLLA